VPRVRARAGPCDARRRFVHAATPSAAPGVRAACNRILPGPVPQATRRPKARDAGRQPGGMPRRQRVDRQKTPLDVARACFSIAAPPRIRDRPCPSGGKRT